ncbi:GGDEF domain-containing protein [Agrobacterium rubi]|nr:GGDEF domain-containing protein [Agrobacterium rubi]NTF24452.1 GGDEF domain-containing protein [Agrobacterium rubi]
MTNNSKMMEPALRVLKAMAHVGAVPHPKNYEVFYAAVTGTIPKLGGALMLLGANPTQEEIDEVALKFFPERSAENAATRMTGTMGRELNALGNTLVSEERSMKAFGGAVVAARNSLEQASRSGGATPEKLTEFMNVVIDALSDRQEQGSRAVQRVNISSRKMEELERENEKLRLMANTDVMSKLFNRRAFDEKISSVYDSSIYTKGAALIVMDIDKFKQINDKFGHPVGDMVIAAVADRIKGVMRKGTFVARTGGEEFAIIVEANDRETGNDGISHATLAQIGERVRAGVESLSLTIPRTSTPVGRITVSVGVCSATDADNPGDLYQNADAALYRAKQAGRNRVMFHEPPVADNELESDGRYLMYGR